MDSFAIVINQLRYWHIIKQIGITHTLLYIYFGLIQNIWIHIWCLTSCGVRSASARAFHTCAREVREQRQARARDARANRGARAREVREQGQDARARSHAHPSDTRARANKLSARANKLSKSQISSTNPLLESLFARACVSDGRAHARASWPCLRTSRAMC